MLGAEEVPLSWLMLLPGLPKIIPVGRFRFDEERMEEYPSEEGPGLEGKLRDGGESRTESMEIEGFRPMLSLWLPWRLNLGGETLILSGRSTKSRSSAKLRLGRSRSIEQGLEESA